MQAAAQKTKSRQGFERGRKAREITPRMPSGMHTKWHVTSQRSHPFRDAPPKKQNRPHSEVQAAAGHRRSERRYAERRLIKTIYIIG
jgi:hypothetical protein